MDDTFESFAIIPAPARALATDVMSNLFGYDLNTFGPTGAEFFHGKDLQVMKDLIKEKIKKNPNAKSGVIEYKDYPTNVEGVYHKGGFDKVVDIFSDPEQRVKKTLGQFSWKKDDQGNIRIADQFNFNDAPAKDEMDLLERLRAVQADLDYEGLNFYDNTYGAIRKTAQMFGSPEGSGRMFDINLGKLD